MDMVNLFENAAAVCITEPSNLLYFSGFANADAVIVLMHQKKYYITDKRVAEEARTVLADFEVVDTGNKSYLETAVAIICEQAPETVGFEDQTIKYKDYTVLSALPCRLMGISARTDEIRAVKTPRELELIKKAQAITDGVYDYILSAIREGMSERELCSLIDSRIYAKGGSLAFETIAAFGNHTSMPHSHPSDKTLTKGDAVLIDFGAKYGGYCSDMTRCFSFGKPSEDYKKIYSLVCGAQRAALDKLYSGVTGKEGYAIAKNYFAEHGLDRHFTHSLGHSLGIDIHEDPRLSPKWDKPIPEGAVMSVEPGLYFEGLCGVRIEDIVVFEKKGIYSLTNSTKELIIL